jgi:hypothetical protein
MKKTLQERAVSISTNLLWWENVMIYQMYSRSFADGDGDGDG